MRGVKFIEERKRAVRLRKRGFSIVEIEKKLGINRSTLSGWFKDIQLGQKQRARLAKHWQAGLMRARAKALVWHNTQKRERVAVAEKAAENLLAKIDCSDQNLLELALSMLYSGEGFKHDGNPGMGNSDPLVLKFFIHVLRVAYKVTPDVLTAQLHLRADQNERKEVMFWSKSLGLPIENFKWTQFDRRTIGRKTYKNYHGVCTIYCYDVAIQRKLANISKQFIGKLLRS
jgi:hypothetical protein